jgi:hypothetical protein
MDLFQILADVGFPMTAAIAAGYFVFLTIKFILAGVASTIKGMSGIIIRLDTRVSEMNNDVMKIDILVSDALGLKPDVERVARTNHTRKD